MRCEVVGWVFIDTDQPKLLVREARAARPRSVSVSETVADRALQTGAFRRDPIVDPLTRQTIGYEMEALPTPFA